MNKLKVLDLFSGIGGFSLGLERTGGFETVAFCEIEEFPRKVLAKHWPEVPIYHDVRTLTKDILDRDGIAVDVICGGFPCQDISTAGKQAGMGAGTRSGLWSEIVRLVCELRPQFVVVENVAALLAGPSQQPGAWFGRVLGDLAECGYDAEWENIPASALGAPHRRERVWIVAYPEENRNQKQHTPSIGKSTATQKRAEFTNKLCAVVRGGEANVSNANFFDDERQQPCGINSSEWGRSLTRQAGSFFASVRGQWEIEPAVGRVAHGVPDRTHRLAALGNAVVPQIPELIGHAILQSMRIA